MSQLSATCAFDFQQADSRLRVFPGLGLAALAISRLGVDYSAKVTAVPLPSHCLFNVLPLFSHSLALAYTVHSLPFHCPFTRLSPAFHRASGG